MEIKLKHIPNWKKSLKKCIQFIFELKFVMSETVTTDVLIKDTENSSCWEIKTKVKFFLEVQLIAKFIAIR